MPFASVAVPLPADTQEVRAGDVDGDGRDELIVTSRTPRPGAPATVKLTVIGFGAEGAVASRHELDLGSRPLVYDIDHGLWAIDRDGLVRLDPAGGAPTRLAKFPSALAALGPTTPRQAPIAHDLDHDGVPELVAWSAGRYLAFRADGTPMGSVPAPADGAVETDWSIGAATTRATLSTPALSVADLDGDGLSDLLLPSGATLAVYFTGQTVGVRAATIPLPLDLEPPEERAKPGETRRQIAGVWFDDIDGDGKCDLGVQRLVLTGSWFGATAELSWARGRGDGFGALATLPVNAAAFGVTLVDAEGDHDRDFLAPVADVGIGTLARALVARSVRVDLSLFRMDAGVFQPPVTLRTLAFPLESPDRLQVDLSADVDGDGRLDLVTNDGEDRVRVYRGKAGGVEATAAWDQPIVVPLGDNTLFVHDLTGDKHAEVLVWGPKEKAATLLRAQ